MTIMMIIGIATEASNVARKTSGRVMHHHITILSLLLKCASDQVSIRKTVSETYIYKIFTLKNKLKI